MVTVAVVIVYRGHYHSPAPEPSDSLTGQCLRAGAAVEASCL